MRRLVGLLLAASCAGQLWSQSCQRPVAGGAGLATTVELDVAVVYSDGYLTTGHLVRPQDAPPACGWPLVVFVHRLGSSQAEDLTMQQQIAAHGYALWAYDVRGQGGAQLLNGGHPQAGATLWGPIERCDLAEQIQFVAARPEWQGLVDGTRVAVLGSSQGAGHAWAAAAWSGAPLLVPGRTASTFPSIACAIAADYAPEATTEWLRGGNLFSSWFTSLIANDTVAPSFVLDSAFVQLAAGRFRAADPAGLLAAWAAEDRPITQRLQQTAVPILFSQAYDDLIDSPLPGLQLLAQLPAGTSKRALLSTIGHNTPPNDHELALRFDLYLRWLDRFLWSEHNEVELESQCVLAELPLEPSLRLDPDQPWGHVYLADPLPPPSADRYWLSGDGGEGVLVASPPAVAEPPAAIDQLLAEPGFNAANYLASAANRDLAAVLAACPLSEQVFTTTLATERQLDRSPVVQLEITPDRSRWMIAALLTVQPPGGDEVMLSSAGVARDSSQAGIAETVTLPLSPVAVVLPAGTVLRLRLRNLWLREAPLARALETAPLFHDFHLAIGKGPEPGSSFVDLPLHARTPQLVTRTHAIDLLRMDPVTLLLRGGPGMAGYVYYLTIGSSGQVPVTWRHGTSVMLQADWLSGAVESAILAPEFSGFLGDLDGAGAGAAVLDLSRYAPFDPLFLGVRLTFAAFVFPDFRTPLAVASNPLDLLMH
ncbi:MAG TPA: hypothetical protein VK348_16045 [Planctomycetota bacterium]|nr:hypothetical protein [Planctomycetota bacterium]